MVMRDEDFAATLTPTEADGRPWLPPMATPGPRDLRSLYEQAQARAEAERARAEAAEARCEELVVAERAARSRAGSLKSNLEKSRDKLKAAIEEVKEVRRAAKDALFYQSEVARLEKLLSQAGVDSRKRGTITSLRMEVFRLREALQALQTDETAGALRQAVDSLTRENARLSKALERSQEQKNELTTLRRKVAALLRSKRPAQVSRPRASIQLRKTLERARKQKDTIKALRGEVGSANREARRLSRENRRLRRELEPLPDLKKTVRRLTAEAGFLRQALAVFGDQTVLIDSQSWRIFQLERALGKSAEEKKRLEAELAERPLLSAVFRTVRARNKTIESLHKEIARQRSIHVCRQGFYGCPGRCVLWLSTCGLAFRFAGACVL